MSGVSNRNIIYHQFNFDIYECELWIVYEIIIEQYQILQLGTIANFNKKILEFDVNLAPIKDQIQRIGQPSLTII